MFRRSSRKPDPPPVPTSPPPTYTLPSLQAGPEMSGLDRYRDRTVSSPGKAKFVAGSASVGSFHKPSSLVAREKRGGSERGHDAATIASLYAKSDFTPHSVPWELGPTSKMPRTPTAKVGAPATPSPVTHGLRKGQRIPPAFNVMAVGASGTGKTSFLRTVLATSRFCAPMPTQRKLERDHALAFGTSAAVAKTGDEVGPRKLVRTEKAETIKATVQSEDGLGEKLALTLVDTAGFDWPLDGLRVDMAINAILRLIETRFDDTLALESQVHRNPQRAGESHVHLVLYFIHPSTLVPRPASTTASANGTTGRRKSKETDDGLEELKMGDIDLRQIKRLSRRTNVLPIIARADELTDDRLAAVRSAILRDLKSIGVGFGVFDSSDSESSDEGEDDDVYSSAGPGDDSGIDDEMSRPAPKPDPPVPRRRVPSAAPSTPTRRFRGGGRSSSLAERPSLSTAFLDVDEPGIAEHGVGSFKGALPFTVIAPEQSAEIGPLEGKEGEAEREFVRTYRWGRVDVLDPKHCDFTVLKAALLGSHMRLLKDATRHTHYEDYRSERLSASSRTTMHDRLRARQEVESLQIPSVSVASANEIAAATTGTPAPAAERRPGPPTMPGAFERRDS